MEKLYQKNFFKEKTFKITRKGLKIKEKTISKNIELTVFFENMTSDIKVFQFKKTIWKLLAIISMLLMLIPIISGVNQKSFESILKLTPISIILTVFFIFIYIYTYESYIMIICVDSMNIPFFKKKNAENEVMEFINKVLAKRKEYLKEKFAYVDYDIPYENQIRIFYKLKEEQIITLEEYEDLKEKLKV